jgi:hypothetical protein
MSGYVVTTTQLRRPGGAILAGSIVVAHLPTAVGLPCPLRTLTGVPCPFCGTTTALRALAGGHVTQSLAAAPLGVVVAATAVLAVTKRLPARIVLPWPALVLGLAAEWAFELVRFHVI